jgi:hypothetical protein
MPAIDAPATFAVLGAGFLVLVPLGFRALQQRRALVGIPTSAAAGVHIGLNRVQGTACPLGEPLVSPLTSTECVGWSSSVEEEWRKESIWRWRRRTRWRVLAEETSESDFDLVDDSGEIRVAIAGATITGYCAYRREILEGDPEFLEVAQAAEAPGGTGRRRVVELVIPLATPTTVVGTARLRDDAPKPELTWDPDDRRLMVSSIGLSITAARQAVTAVFLLLGAIGLLAIAPLAIRPSDTEYWRAVEESDEWIPVLVVGALLVFVAYWLRYVFNDLVGLRERVARAHSLIAVELQRRHDLLPSLANVVSEGARHEQELLAKVAQVRVPDTSNQGVSGFEQVDRADAEAAAEMIAVAERQPELRADEGFRQIQHSIVDAEDRIALARGFYNDSVTLYNERRAEMPASIVASAFRFRPAMLYRANLDVSGSQSS